MNKIPIFLIAGYTRISLDEAHQRYSLSAQEDRIREYIKSHSKDGYVLFKIYSDQKSGGSLDRPGLQGLLKDAEKGRFQAILIVKTDRLCRNLADQIYLIEQLKRWGIRLLATDEDIDLETPDGITWTQIRGAFNEAERRRISYRTRMGMDKKAQLGEWCGGYVPFGYSHNKVEKALVPDDEQKAIVEEIFHLYSNERVGAKGIAVKLNKKGHRTRSGNYFSTASVLAIITNPIYAGQIRRKEKIFPGKHKPLIGKKTFDKAQAILSERRGNLSLRRSNSSNYLLSGLLHCERCGRWLVGKCAHGRGGIYTYYVCWGKLKYGECDLNALPQVAVDKAILIQIKKVFQNEVLIKRILNKVKVKLNKKLPKKVAELKSLEREMQRKETIKRRYRAAFETGSLDPQEFGSRVSELDEETQLLRQREVQLKDELTNLKVQPVTFKDIQEMMGRFEKVIMSAPPSETKGPS